MIERIFLDMDGVITDFVSTALQLHNAESAAENWPPGEWYVHKVLGLSRQQFWDRVDEAGEDRWANLEPYPWMSDLLSLLAEFAPVTILSSPSLNPGSAAGKMRWLDKHLGGGRPFRDFIFTSQKHLLASPHRVLVDDSDKNVKAFGDHFGQAIVFPQQWNSNHSIGDRLEFVRAELTRFEQAEA